MGARSFGPNFFRAPGCVKRDTATIPADSFCRLHRHQPQGNNHRIDSLSRAKRRNPMGKAEYLKFQISLICLLTFVDGMAFLARHPDWFR